MDHGMGLAGMRTGKNAPKGKPFFAIFNHTVSHESKIRLREKTFPHHKIEDASIPPYHPNIPETKGIGLSIMQISLSLMGW